MQKIGIIGGGKMGCAFYEGLKDAFGEEQIYLCEKDAERLATLQIKNSSTDADEILAQVEVVILAVKPQVFEELSNAIQTDLSQKLVISIMAGVSLEKLKGRLKAAKVVRSMPNLAAQVGESVTAWIATEEVQDKDLLKQIFSSLGTELEVEKEEMLDAVTAISGSGPAYFFYLAELLQEQALEFGFSEEDSKKLAESTFTGAAKLLAKNNLSNKEWREAVTSKGGTTEAALNKMKIEDFDKIFKDAVEAARKRSEELRN